jgi:hypothetical protein
LALQSGCIDEDEAAREMIERNTAAARLIESRQGPPRAKEAVMSLETALECRRKADEVAERLRARAQAWQDGPHGE